MTPLRVVLVEDDRQVARVNRDLIEQNPGVRVVGMAENCAEGDRLVQTLTPDLVLLDVYLPDGTGLELLRRWRARGERTEVVMITAADDLPSVRAAITLGAADYLIKPFDAARLEEALSRHRARRRHQQDVFTQARLDRYLGVAGGGTLPKGIEGHTLERVADLLAAGGAALSAEDVGGRVGLSRVTAWRYLEYLVQTGKAELDFTYGNPGRPAKLYRAAR